MTVPTIDDVLDFNPTGGGGGGSNDYIPDGYWWMGLTEISMPFQEPDFNDPTNMVTKIRFHFEVAGTYDRKTGEVVASEFDGQKASIKVKADANGPKSTKYLIASALLGQDLAAYVNENGKIKPTELLTLCCWAKIENEAGKKDPSTSYTKMLWNGFTATLPAHLTRPVPQPAARPNAAPQRPVAPGRPAVAQQPKAEPPF